MYLGFGLFEMLQSFEYRSLTRFVTMKPRGGLGIRELCITEDFATQHRPARIVSDEFLARVDIIMVMIGWTIIIKNKTAHPQRSTRVD